MPQRLALAAGALAATVVLTVGLVAAGFAPISSGQPVAASLDGVPTDEPLAEPSLEPEIVYVRPAPTPETIVLEKQAPAGTRNRSTSSSPRERDDDGDERREREDDERHEREHDDDEREHDEREDDDHDEREGDDD